MQTPSIHTLTVSGMQCGHCEQLIQEAIEGLDAQAQVHIDRSAGTVTVHSCTGADAIRAAIEAEDFAVTACHTRPA